jgi:hypothetical protein
LSNFKRLSAPKGSSRSPIFVALVLVAIGFGAENAKDWESARPAAALPAPDGYEEILLRKFPLRYE